MSSLLAKERLRLSLSLLSFVFQKFILGTMSTFISLLSRDQVNIVLDLYSSRPAWSNIFSSIHFQTNLSQCPLEAGKHQALNLVFVLSNHSEKRRECSREVCLSGRSGQEMVKIEGEGRGCVLSKHQKDTNLIIQMFSVIEI